MRVLEEPAGQKETEFYLEIRKLITPLVLVFISLCLLKLVLLLKPTDS